MDQMRRRKAVLLFLVPSLLFYIIFMIAPLFQSLYYAFFKWKGVGPMKYVGFDNFIKLFTDDRIIRLGFRNTLYLLLISMLVMFPISFLLANSLVSIKRKTKLYSTVFYLPNVVSTVIVALMWSFIFNYENGVVNNFLRLIHLESLEQVWLGDPNIAIFTVILVNTWQFVGLHMIIFYTSLQSIPTSIYEAAEIDGAYGIKKLWHITLPLMREPLKMNTILIAIGSLKAFDLVWAMTYGGPNDATQLLSTYMYHNTFRRFQFGYGSAIAMTIFVLALAASFIIQKLFAQREKK